MKNHVVSLELSKQLKEAGYPQGAGNYVWASNTGKDFFFAAGCVNIKTWNIEIMAPLASELMERLPYRLRLDDADFWLCIAKLKYNTTDIRYRKSQGVTLIHNGEVVVKQDDNMANALAEMWLYLNKERLLEE